MKQNTGLFKKNILLRTNLLVCLVIVAGFLITAVLSYKANYSASLESIEQVSDLSSEGIYYQMSAIFTKPIHISLTMANDSLLKELLGRETISGQNPGYIATLREYLAAYQKKYGYDSVFLVSSATGGYYNFNGLDRILKPDDPENAWYYAMLKSGDDYSMNVDNDEVAGADNEITVFVNCKIFGEDGSVLGVVGVGLRVDYLQNLLRQYQQQFGVGVYLIDGAGDIQISGDHTGYQAVNFFEAGRYGAEASQKLLGWKEGEEAYSFWALAPNAGGRNYIVTRYFPEVDWHLVVEQDTGPLLKALNRQLALTVLIIAVILALVLWVITQVIRSFNRRIVDLTQEREQERKSVFEKATGELYENIYELDVTHNRPANRETEEYFESLGAPAGASYEKGLYIIAQAQIKEEFRQGYIDTFRPENVIRAYEEGRETLCYEFMISQGGAAYYWMRITARIVRWESDGSIHMLTYRQNIDEEKRREQQMLTLAQTDEMTGLLTKTATQRRAGEMLAQEAEENYALFLFDIDNFKQANDQFGHAFGDKVIQRFAQILRGHFRENDVVGRIGGDEFAAFVPAPDKAWVEAQARALAGALCETYTTEGESWPISASIGAAFDAGGKSWNDFYKEADAALYATKKRGKNGFTVSPPPPLG